MSEDQLDGLLEAMALKDLPRAGWLRCGVREPESVAAHSWGVCLLVLHLLPAELDLGRALSYAALHDLPEVRVGDLTPHDDVSDKAAREQRAMVQMSAHLPRGPRSLALWLAYEAQADAESRFVRQLDRVDMALQAVRYHEAGAPGMLQFVQSATRFVDDPVLVRIVEECGARVSVPYLPSE